MGFPKQIFHDNILLDFQYFYRKSHSLNVLINRDLKYFFSHKSFYSYLFYQYNYFPKILTPQNFHFLNQFPFFLKYNFTKNLLQIPSFIILLPHI